MELLHRGAAGAATRAPRAADPIALFQARPNIDYLAALHAGVPHAAVADAVRRFVGSGRARAVLDTDVHAQRGALDAWGEVRRLNRAFAKANERDQVATDEPDEPHHLREFNAHRQLPKGFEQDEEWGSTPPSGAPLASHTAVYGTDEAPWSAGNPGRSAEQAAAEFYGDTYALSTTQYSAPREFQSDAAVYGGGARAGGARLMRREGIPLWQKGGRQGIARDVADSLGAQVRELEGQSRGVAAPPKRR